MVSIKTSTIGKARETTFSFKSQEGFIIIHIAARQKRVKRQRVRYAPKPTDIGYLVDTVLYFVDGIRNYFYSAVDVKSKFAFSYHYKHLNSQNTVDFIKKVSIAYPFPIKTIQTTG